MKHASLGARCGSTLLLVSLSLTLLMSAETRAQTTVPSDNGHPWDVLDTTSSDTGGISDGGDDAFDGFGMVRLRTRDGSGTILTGDVELSGFGLVHDGGRRFSTTSPVSVDGVQVTRALYAPLATDYMRYIDTFTNTGGAARQIQVAWGGNLGSDSNTTVAATSSGDLSITAADAWALTIENGSFDSAGPATDPPVGYVFQDPASGWSQGVGDYFSIPFDTPWPGNGNDDPAFVFGTVVLAPGESVSLAYFLYRGLEENTTGPLGQTPVTGEEIAAAQTVLAALAVSPDFGDLAPAERAAIINWNLGAGPAAIPTLSHGALSLLALMLGLIAWVWHRRRLPV